MRAAAEGTRSVIVSGDGDVVVKLGAAAASNDVRLFDSLEPDGTGVEIESPVGVVDAWLDARLRVDGTLLIDPSTLGTDRHFVAQGAHLSDLISDPSDF